MHYWYRAVCDAHKETCHVLVKSNGNVFDTSKNLLEDQSTIVAWLDAHYGCELRLVWRDDQLEAGAEHLLSTHHDANGRTCFCVRCKPARHQ